MKRAAVIAAVIVTAWMFNAAAADEQDGLKGPSNVKRLGSDQAQGGNQQVQGSDKQQGGQGREGGQRPVPPLIKALDANGDGVIDADEIANASAALKKLDKNGDGKLTRDEFMPPRPPRPEGGQGGGDGQQGNSDHRGPPPQEGADNQK